MHHHALVVYLVVLGILSLAGAEVIVQKNDITTKGKTFRVICQVQEETFVGWFNKNGTKISSQDEFQKFHYRSLGGNRYELVVKNVVVPDGGMYQCRGSNTVKNFTLYVEFYVIDSPKNQEFIATQTANIKCAAVGYPQPVYRWFRERVEIDHQKDPRYTIMKNGTLQIQNINESDPGRYTCRITQLSFLERTREEEREIQVVVYAPPRIKLEESSTILYTYTGNPKKTRIRCYFWGFPKPNITLLKKGKKIKSVNGKDLIKGTVKTRDGKKALDNYTCEAVNSYGMARHVVQVREAAPPTPPRNITTIPHCDCLTVAWEPPIDTGGFPISLYIQEVSFNGTVVTTANVGSSPRTYTFTRHLKPNTEYKLIIFGKTVAKKGEKAEIIVKTSPCPPSGEMFILNEESTINSTNLTVRWSRPPDDGGEKNISYILEYSKADMDGAYVQWISRRKITRQQLVVEGLVRGSYLFHVVATNSAGRNKHYAQKTFFITPGTLKSTVEPTFWKHDLLDPNLVYNMEVICTSQGIKVVLNVTNFPGLDFASFQLKETRCKPKKVTDTQLVLSTFLNGCGTTQQHHQLEVIYFNTVIARVGNPNSTFYMVEFPFSCTFGKEKLIGTPSFQARRKISTFEAGKGNLAFVMKLFPTPEYETPYSVSDYPVQVDPRQSLYCQVELYASDPNLVIFIDSCVATPTMHPTDSIRYSFIKNGKRAGCSENVAEFSNETTNTKKRFTEMQTEQARRQICEQNKPKSCAVDQTVTFNHQANNTFQRFTILPFKFKNSPQSKVYLHCKVLVCHAESETSRCAKGCVTETRRMKKEIGMQLRVHHVTLGPVLVADQITEQNKRKSSEHSEKRKVSVLVIIFVLLGVALLTVCIYGVYHVLTSPPRGLHVRIPTE